MFVVRYIFLLFYSGKWILPFHLMGSPGESIMLILPFGDNGTRVLVALQNR